jgi:DNA-3-methyladenine glycosylase II
MTHTTFQLEAPAGFSLSAAAEFYAGFSPMGGAARRDADSLQLVFLLDGTFTPVSARLSPSPPAEERVGERRRALHLAVEGTTDELRVAIQISRMLGLDADAPAWLDLGKRDPLVGGLQRSFPGFFTAGFPSPYEAGVSGVLSHRSSVKQAASIRRALSKAHGTELDGVFALPTPRQLLAAKGFTSIPDAKWKVLQGLDGGAHALARSDSAGRVAVERAAGAAGLHARERSSRARIHPARRGRFAGPGAEAAGR